MISRAVGIIVVLGSAYASIIGLYFTLYPLSSTRPDWHWLVLIILSVIFVWLIFSELRRLTRECHRVYKNKKAIDNYMCRWVSNAGRTAILSRDLSWGSTHGAKRALLAKARANELVLFVHHETPLSKELVEAGAEVTYYRDSGFEPRSRFTVIGYGKEGSRVAVGTTKNANHIVYEYDAGEHPITALSDDLLLLISLASSK